MTTKPTTPEPQDTPVAATPAPRKPDTLYKCPAHDRWFPAENPWRPISEWSHNAGQLEPLRTYCKRCDNKNKEAYSGKEKAVKGEDALERTKVVQKKRQAELDALIDAGKEDTREAASIREHLAYLDERITMLTDHFHLPG